jgi:hypothetical protein
MSVLYGDLRFVVVALRHRLLEHPAMPHHHAAYLLRRTNTAPNVARMDASPPLPPLRRIAPTGADHQRQRGRRRRRERRNIPARSVATGGSQGGGENGGVRASDVCSDAQGNRVQLVRTSFCSVCSCSQRTFISDDKGAERFLVGYRPSFPRMQTIRAGDRYKKGSDAWMDKEHRDTPKCH